MLYVPKVLLVLEYRRPSLFTGCCTQQALLPADRGPLSSIYYTIVIVYYMYLS